MEIQTTVAPLKLIQVSLSSTVDPKYVLIGRGGGGGDYDTFLQH